MTTGCTAGGRIPGRGGGFGAPATEVVASFLAHGGNLLTYRWNRFASAQIRAFSAASVKLVCLASVASPARGGDCRTWSPGPPWLPGLRSLALGPGTDPAKLAEFWALALDYELQPPPEGFDSWDQFAEKIGLPQEERLSAIVDPDSAKPRIFIQKVPEGKVV